MGDRVGLLDLDMNEPGVLTSAENDHHLTSPFKTTAKSISLMFTTDPAAGRSGPSGRGR